MNLLIIGNYGSTNLGDELILHGLINFLKDKFSSQKINFLVFSHSPSFSKQFGQLENTSLTFVRPLPFGFRSFFKSFFSGQILTSLKFYWQADLVVLGGGGLFQDQEKTAPFLWLSRLIPAILLRKKIISIGTSLWPLNTLLSQRITTFCYHYCTETIFRDSYSQNLLKKLSPQQKNISVTLDMVSFLLFPQIDTLNNSTLLVNLRSCPHNDSQIVEKISKIINNVVDYYSNFLFVSFENNRSNDYLLLKKVYQKLSSPVKQKTTLLDPKELQTKQAIISLYQKVTTVLSMRLHPLIIGALTNKKLIPLSYSPKVENYLRENNLSKYIFNSKNINVNKIITTLKKKYTKSIRI